MTALLRPDTAPAPEGLNHAEAEFVSEMSQEEGDANGWMNFDPDFRQKDIARLIRRGWFERRTDEHGYRVYRWTEAGRAALASPPFPARAAGETP